MKYLRLYIFLVIVAGLLFNVNTNASDEILKSGIKIDRKILAEIAYDSPEAFKTIIKKAQSALN